MNEIECIKKYQAIEEVYVTAIRAYEVSGAASALPLAHALLSSFKDDVSALQDWYRENESLHVGIFVGAGYGTYVGGCDENNDYIVGLKIGKRLSHLFNRE